ncbi:MAG TPA: AlpA family phage regulatory protein [Allosphingosinicella sp.]|jgi:prophage regulatory protein
MSSGKPERILRISAVLERTGLSRSTLYRKLRAGAASPHPSLVR